jgi:uncharacterized membrane protein
VIVLADAFASTSYNIVLFLHILSAVVAFAPGFVNPVLGALSRQSAPQIAGPLADLQARSTRTLYLPALVAVGVFGTGLVLLSEDSIEFSQIWISISYLGWLAVVGIVGFVLLPAEKALAAGDETAEKRIAMFGGIAHLLFAVVLYCMVFQPGR